MRAQTFNAHAEMDKDVHIEAPVITLDQISRMDEAGIRGLQERALMQQQRLDKVAQQDAQHSGLVPPVAIDPNSHGLEEHPDVAAQLRVGALVALTGTNQRRRVSLCYVPMTLSVVCSALQDST